jgi:SIR2-like domain
MTNIPPELVRKLADKQVIPFVGAGVSMSLGLPSYASLIRQIGEEVGFDGDIFHGLGDYLTLAEYYHLHKKGLDSLQAYLRNSWKRSQKDVMASPVHQALVGLGCDLIYTTNFDGFIEQAHRGLNRRYRAIRSVKDLVNLRDGRTHIVKLHGDLSSPSTMVFTESSYFERLSFESPLDVKLRSDALGKSLLFVGYSLSDINIRYLLFRLQKQWETESKKNLRPKSYIFLGRPNPVQEDVLRNRGIEPIIATGIDPALALSEFLAALRSEADVLSKVTTALTK